MKKLGWICLMLVGSAFPLAITFYPFHHPLQGTTIGDIDHFLKPVYFFLWCGSIWAIYRAIRYEKEPFLYFLLALVPFGFLYYYFEIVKSKRPSPRSCGVVGRKQMSVGWYSLLICSSLVTLLLVIVPWKFPLQGATLVAMFIFAEPFFLIMGIGSIWMLYQAVRYENHPMSYVLLALVPYAFVYYYFETVKVKRQPRDFG
jgi:hypothetical protein